MTASASYLLTAGPICSVKARASTAGFQALQRRVPSADFTSQPSLEAPSGCHISQMFCFAAGKLGLKRWPSSPEHGLSLQTTGVEVPAPTWRLTAVHTAGPGSDAFVLPWARRSAHVRWGTYTHSGIHTRFLRK